MFGIRSFIESWYRARPPTPSMCGPCSRPVRSRRLHELLDKFFEGTFSVDLSSGHVRLENLVIKPSTLPVHLPVELERGQIGAVSIELPLLRLLSRPVRVVVEGVVLKLKLHSEPLSDNEALALAAVARLTDVVGILQDKVAERAAEKAKGKAGAGAGGGFGGGLLNRLLARVLQNLELKVADVQVCVWDDISPTVHHCGGSGDSGTLRWAAGVHLGEMRLGTLAGKAWQMGVGGNEALVHKV